MFPHQGKGDQIVIALLKAGWENTVNPADTDLLLVDHDGPFAHPRPEAISACYEAGAKIVMYPHGANPSVTFYDGAYDPDSRVHARFEHGEGPVEIARRIGLVDDLRQRVIGWSYTEMRPFEPVTKTADDTLVMFAPIQPNGNGELADYDHETNQQAWDQISRLPVQVEVQNPGMPRTVRASYELILQADVVVAAGTFAYTAIALGKPVVMLHDENRELGMVPTNLELYDDYMRYPLTVGDAPIQDLFAEACEGSDRVRDWAGLFVGGPMIDVASLLENIVKGETSSPQPISLSQAAT